MVQDSNFSSLVQLEMLGQLTFASMTQFQDIPIVCEDNAISFVHMILSVIFLDFCLWLFCSYAKSNMSGLYNE